MSYGTVRLERCTDNRPPFRTSQAADGNRAHYAHTSNGIKLCAPLDLSTDGQFASLQIVGDAGFSFGVGSWAQNIMGFGFGALYTNPLDTEIGTHIDPITGREWLLEASPYTDVPWKVKEHASGMRYIESKNKTGGRNIAFDSGVATPENTTVFSSSLFFGVYDFIEGENPVQLKTVRFCNVPGGEADARNSFYLHVFDKTPYNGNKSAAVYYDDAGVLRIRGVRPAHHPEMNSEWTLQIVVANSGSYDQENGLITTADARESANYSELNAADNGTIGTGTNLRLMQSQGLGTWRVANIQDYYDDAIEGESRNLTFRRADIIKQFGSAERLMIGDGITPALSTWPVTNIPIILHVNTNTIVFPWHKGMIDSFAGKYLHYFNDAGTYVGSCATGVTL
jgi:hypothetical protein